ncbi:MAG: putative metal-binding motif-containing protein [archaeon]
MKNKKSILLTLITGIIFISLINSVSAQICIKPPCDCDGDGYNTTECGGNDCDDITFEINPGVEEVCGSGLDMNCDGLYDCYDPQCCDQTSLCSASPSPLWIDKDGDSYAICEGDCDDITFEINPGVEEVCGSGLDMNCNGLYDCYDSDCCTDNTRCPNEYPYWWFDADHDGFKTCQNDCNDNDASINPNAAEICDLIDNNCDGLDGFNNDGDSYTTCYGDCNDTNQFINPSVNESENNGCIDGVDNNCDEMIDCEDSDCFGTPSCEGIPEYPLGFIIPIMITIYLAYKRKYIF